MPPFLSGTPQPPLSIPLSTIASPGAPWLVFGSTTNFGKNTLLESPISGDVDMFSFARKSATSTKSTSVTNLTGKNGVSSPQARKESQKDLTSNCLPKIADSPSANSGKQPPPTTEYQSSGSSINASADRGKDKSATKTTTTPIVPSKRNAEAEIADSLSSTKGKRKKVATAKGAAFFAETSSRKRKSKQKNPDSSAAPKDSKGAKGTKSKPNTPGVGVFSVAPGGNTDQINGFSISTPSVDEQCSPTQAGQALYSGTPGDESSPAISPASRWNSTYPKGSPQRASSPPLGPRSITKSHLSLPRFRDVRSSPSDLMPLPHPELSIPPPRPDSWATPTHNKGSPHDIITISSSSSESVQSPINDESVTGESKRSCGLSITIEDSGNEDQITKEPKTENKKVDNAATVVLQQKLQNPKIIPTPILLQNGVNKFFNKLVTIKEHPVNYDNVEVSKQLDHVIDYLCQNSLPASTNSHPTNSTKTPSIVDRFKGLENMHKRVEFLMERIAVRDAENRIVSFQTWSKNGRRAVSGHAILAEHPAQWPETLDIPAVPAVPHGSPPPFEKHANLSLQPQDDILPVKTTSEDRLTRKKSGMSPQLVQKATTSETRNQRKSLPECTPISGDPELSIAAPNVPSDTRNGITSSEKSQAESVTESGLSSKTSKLGVRIIKATETLENTDNILDTGRVSPDLEKADKSVQKHVENRPGSPGELFATEELKSCLRDVEARYGVKSGLRSELSKGLTMDQIARELREASKDVFDWGRVGNEEMQLSTCEAFLRTIYSDKDIPGNVPLAPEFHRLDKEDGLIPKPEVERLSIHNIPAESIDLSDDMSMEDTPIIHLAPQGNSSKAKSKTVNGVARSITTPPGNEDTFSSVVRKSIVPTVSAEQYLQGCDMEGLRDQWRDAASRLNPLQVLRADAKHDSLLQKILDLDKEEQDIELQIAALEDEESLRRAEFKSRELSFTTVAKFRDPLSCSTDWAESSKLLTEQEEFAFNIYCQKRKLKHKGLLIADEKMQLVERRKSRIGRENLGTEAEGTVLDKPTETSTNEKQDVVVEDGENSGSGVGFSGWQLARGNKVGSQLLQYLAKIPGWPSEVVGSVEPGFEPGPGPGKRKRPRKKMNW